MLSDAFTRIYGRNEWRAGSGTGSDPAANIEYVAMLSRFMALNDVRSVVDFGCGDWQFSRLIDWSRVDYLGVDVVPQIIDELRARHASATTRFELFSDVAELPRADLLLCKDVFQHLPNELVQAYLKDFQHRFRWLLITNDDYPADRLNQDVSPGGWRPVRLDKPPFNQRCTTLYSWTVISKTPTVRKRLELILGRADEAIAPPRVAPPPVAQGEPLPKRIMQTWKTKGDLPSNFETWSATVRTMNREFDYVLTDDADNRSFMERCFPWFMERYESYPREIQRVDAYRYFWLFLHGGFYLDLDVECLRPLDSYLNAGDVVLGRMGPDPAFPHSIPNAIMASRPRQEFWLFVMALLLEADVNRSPERSTGPVILKHAVDAWRFDPARARTDAARVAERLDPALRASIRTTRWVELLPPREWYPLDWSDGVHQAFRKTVLASGPLPEGQAGKTFPNSGLVTYWTHSW